MEIILDARKYYYITRKIELTTAITDFICFQKYIETKEINDKIKNEILLTINKAKEYFENELYYLKKEYLIFCYPSEEKKNL